MFLYVVCSWEECVGYSCEKCIAMKLSAQSQKQRRKTEPRQSAAEFWKLEYGQKSTAYMLE